MSRQISLEEVKKHATEKSSWIVIHHDIYDVTSYLNEHPGGAEALLEFAGKDGTQAFEDVAHSEDARQIMKKYKIGTLPERERESPKCNDCCEPKHVSKKTWRNYDGSSTRSRSREGSSVGVGSGRSSRGGAGSGVSLPGTPKNSCVHCRMKRAPGPCTQPHVKAIVVPPGQRRQHPSSSSAGGSYTLTWMLIALAGAIAIGFAVKKFKT